MKPRLREARKNGWILAATWRLVNERVSARRDPAKDQSLIRRMGHAIKPSMSTDRRRREEEAGVEVEVLLGAEPTLIQEAWQRRKRGGTRLWSTILCRLLELPSSGSQRRG